MNGTRNRTKKERGSEYESTHIYIFEKGQISG